MATPDDDWPLPDPNDVASITEVRFIAPVAAGKSVMCIQIKTTTGRSLWGPLSPENNAALMGDMMAMAIKLGELYAMPAVREVSGVMLHLVKGRPS